MAAAVISICRWVVVLPAGSRNNNKPFKLELAIYNSSQDAQPRILIALWKANLEEPKFRHSDPSVIIDDRSSTRRGRRRRRARDRPQTVSQTRIKLAPANEGDKQQLQWFCDACKGLPQPAHPPVFLQTYGASTAQATAPPAEDLEIAMAINAPIQSSMGAAPIIDTYPSEASASISWNNPMNTESSIALPAPFSAPAKAIDDFSDTGHSGNLIRQNQIQYDTIPAVQAPESVPSAPPVIDDVIADGPVQYPSIDSSPVDMASASEEKSHASSGKENEDGGSSSCVICLDAPVEGACIPCGHMAGCMSCLKEIKAKKWGCPVCRTKIDQVVKLYAV